MIMCERNGKEEENKELIVIAFQKTAGGKVKSCARKRTKCVVKITVCS